REGTSFVKGSPPPARSRELSACLASTPLAMELANGTQRAVAQADFQREALPWLPHGSRYARLLRRNPAGGDDLTQETFLRAYRGWSTFRAGTDCRRWLFAICRNTFL